MDTAHFDKALACLDSINNRLALIVELMYALDRQAGERLAGHDDQQQLRG